MKLNFIFLLVFLIVLAGTCDYSDSRLKVKNNSNKFITVDFSKDTLLPKRSNVNIKFFIRDKIIPGETISKTKPGSINAWPFLIQNSINKKLNVFFIEIDTLSKYTDWEYLRNNKLYYRKEYTIEELENNEWLIEYP